jgi:2-methylcitrate dehydratase PrpD
MTTREASRADGPGVVEQLAAWVLAVRAHDLSQAAVRQAKLLLLDTIGCGFAALNEQSACALLKVMEASGGAPQCTVIGQTRRTSAPNATLANGALVRILDFNDYVNAKSGDLGGHPSDNIPVALAVGELSGASGREVIAAIVLGYEIFGRCKELMERDSAWDGVTVSGLAAPAMAGRLMGLDRGRLAHAIALSAARAATSTAVRFGDISAAKSIANALVAQNGVQAALLAERGITGPLDLFEPASREAADHSFNFLAAVSLIDGEFGLAQFDGERWNDPKVCALMARLEIINDSSWNRRAPDSYPCSFAVRTDDGRAEVVEIPYPPGLSRGRLEAETVMKKFNALAAPHLAQRMRERIIEAVMALDESASCAELMAAVATESAVGSGRSRSPSPS